MSNGSTLAAVCTLLVAIIAFVAGICAGDIDSVQAMQKEAVKHGAAHWETIPSKNGEPAVVKFVWNDEQKTVEF